MSTCVFFHSSTNTSSICISTFAYLFIHLLIYFFTHLFIHPLYVNVSILSFINQSVCLSLSFFSCLSIYLSTFAYLSIYLLIHPFIPAFCINMSILSFTNQSLSLCVYQSIYLPLPTNLIPIYPPSIQPRLTSRGSGVGQGDPKRDDQGSHEDISGPFPPRVRPAEVNGLRLLLVITITLQHIAKELPPLVKASREAARTCISSFSSSCAFLVSSNAFPSVVLSVLRVLSRSSPFSLISESS